MGYAIETRDLTRVFHSSAEVVALDRATIQVREGELFGVLGPNGAGKTTLIKILCTLLLPTSGKAFVGGWDVEGEPQKIREVINMVSGGEVSGYGLLTVRENLWLFSQLYGIPGGEARERIKELLKVVGLEARGDTKVNRISSGERQKMNLCRGLVTDPKILFLDEPTLGLDVNASRAIRCYVKSWLAEKPGRTILLTTHYMHEAEELCDRVAIIDRGKVLACDTPSALKRRVEGDASFRLEVALTDLGLEEMGQLPGVKWFFREDRPERGVTEMRFVLEDEAVIPGIITRLVEKKVKVLHLSKTEPTLEDTFVRIVGKTL